VDGSMATAAHDQPVNPKILPARSSLDMVDLKGSACPVGWPMADSATVVKPKIILLSDIAGVVFHA